MLNKIVSISSHCRGRKINPRRKVNIITISLILFTFFFLLLIVRADANDTSTIYPPNSPGSVVEITVSEDNHTFYDHIVANPNQTIYWRISAINTKDYVLTDMYINDSNGQSYGPFNLDVNESRLFYYTTTAAEDINNTVIFDGKNPDGDVVSGYDHATVDIMFTIFSTIQNIIKDYLYTHDVYFQYEHNTPTFYVNTPKDYKVKPAIIYVSGENLKELVTNLGFVSTDARICDIVVADEIINTSKPTVFFLSSNSVSNKTIFWKKDPLLLEENTVANASFLNISGEIIATYEDGSPAVVQVGNKTYASFEPSEEVLANLLFLYVLEKQQDIPLTAIAVSSGVSIAIGIYLTKLFYERIFHYVFSGILFIVGLAKRFDKNEILTNDLRRGIYNFIVENPATHLRELKREFGISINTTMWHLKVLEDANMISSKKFAHKLHYFPYGVPEDEYVQYLISRNSKIRDILDYLEEEKEAHLRKIARETNQHPETVKHYLTKLQVLDVVESKEDQNTIIYAISPRFVNE